MTLPSGQVVEVDHRAWICLRKFGSQILAQIFLGPGITPASLLPGVKSEFCAQLHVGGEQ